METTYDHTLYFDSVGKQVDYFMGLTKYTMSNQSYQRYDRGAMRVERKADDLYDCNYIMFQNTNYGNKWFYAFITSVEYVNNITSTIYYQIDVMQTWYFDYQLKECFVEREHSVSDAIGSNLVPENLETGDYVSNGYDKTKLFLNWCWAVVASIKVEGRQGPSGEDYPIDDIVNAEGELIGNMYSGLTFNWFNSVDDVNEFINVATGKNKADGIVAILQLPSVMYKQDASSVLTRAVRYNAKMNYDFRGYTPRNNKLYSYPYNFLYVSNNQGNSAVYQYEYFDSYDNIAFDVFCGVSASPTFVLEPANYKGVLASTNPDEQLVLQNPPVCAYTVDSFKAFLAQNWGKLAVNLGAGIASPMLNATSQIWSKPDGGVYKNINHWKAVQRRNNIRAGVEQQALEDIGSNIGGTLASVFDHATMPPQLKGQASGAMTQVNMDEYDFFFYHKHIRPEFARIIDDYFDMFGYATHRVKIPNINSRPHWNYVKTKACVVVGSMPADDLRTICAIYDHGITFWKRGSEVGNYSLDNRP